MFGAQALVYSQRVACVGIASYIYRFAQRQPRYPDNMAADRCMRVRETLKTDFYRTAGQLTPLGRLCNSPIAVLPLCNRVNVVCDALG